MRIPRDSAVVNEIILGAIEASIIVAAFSCKCRIISTAETNRNVDPLLNIRLSSSSLVCRCSVPEGSVLYDNLNEDDKRALRLVTLFYN
jgi:hypothetical protein